MKPDIPSGGVPLGGVPQVPPEIHIYPVAMVALLDGGGGIADATHMLGIALPVQGREVRIPLNRSALVRIGNELLDAATSEVSHDNAD